MKLIFSDTLQLIRQSGILELDDVTVLLTASTGVAVFYIVHILIVSKLLYFSALYITK